MRPKSGGNEDTYVQNTTFKYYEEIVPKPVDWLWYPYIPCGKITLLQGDPGEGKSSFILNIAALLTQGKDMPDGFKVSHPCNVVYQCAEDDAADTIKPRLLQAGADCRRVAFIVDDQDGLTLDDKRIEETIRDTSARLMIFDPLQSFLTQEGDMHSAGRMRLLLSNLSCIAAKYSCAIVLVGHMNKANGGKNLYRGLGSIDIAAIARSVLMISRDQDAPQTRYMFPIKASLAPEGPSISFCFDRKNGFQWLGVSDFHPTINEDSTLLRKGEHTGEMLVDLLSTGPVPSAEIISLMINKGISKRTIYSAKKDLGICSIKKNGIWMWQLSE